MMQFRQKLPAVLVLGIVLAGLLVVVWKVLAPPSRQAATEIVVPELSPLAIAGRTAFDANCAQCHGTSGTGTDKGPPLVHDIYNPGHHADGAFFLAARQGVWQHHWQFGNMPAQPQVSDEDITAIVRYVRDLQHANGTFYRPHTM